MVPRIKNGVLSQKITKGSVDTLNLPRNGIHDAYTLKFKMTLTNGTSAAITPTIKDILEGITEIKVLTDSVRVHYALNGYDLALLNSRLQKVQTGNVLDKTFNSVAASGSQEVEFILCLDEGDILAIAHTNVELSITFADTTKLGLTIASAVCTVQIRETILSYEERVAKYGANWENAVEPKVYATSATCNANTEFTGFHDLPTGTLLRGALLYFTPATAGKYPSEVGILRTVPDRIEIAKEDWDIHREIDRIRHQTIFADGVYLMDYGTDWQSNGVGKNGWDYAKADIQLAAKTEVSQDVRYISIESLVNIGVFAKNHAFTVY